MSKVLSGALLLCLAACNAKGDGSSGRGRPTPSASAAAAPSPKLDLAATRLAKVKPTAIVDAKFGDHGGSFTAEYGTHPVMSADGHVFVPAGPRLFRLTSEGHPDPAFGHGGSVALNKEVWREVLPINGGEAYVQIGKDSPLEPTRVMKMSSGGELALIAPERPLRKLAIDAAGHLFDLRADEEHALFLDGVAPRADSVKLEMEPEKDSVFRCAYAGQKPLLWSAFFFDGAKPDSKLMRFLPTGERDKTFASDGIFRWPSHWQPKCGYVVGAVGLQDGRLAVTGAGCVAVLDAKGRLDARFGKGGIVELSTEFTCDSSPVSLSDGRIALVAHDERRAAELVTLTLQGAKTETVLVEGPVFSSRLAGVDAQGRMLVEIAMHRYITERTTDQETAMIMVRP